MSYREFPISIISEACEKYLKMREEKIAGWREELIKKEMSGWWKSNTREEAIEKLKSQNQEIGFNKWARCRIRGSFNAYKVENIKKLCEVQGGKDTIFIDVETISILF
jgi:predicted metalloendopeptidase